MEKNCKICGALRTIVRILSSREADVFVTGTLGLCMLDFAPEGYVPNDIDLKIEKSQMTKELRAWFKEQESIQGIERCDDYKDETYTLNVKGVKVNIIVSDDAVEHLHLMSNVCYGTYIKVEQPFAILKEKDMLNRVKDKDFVISLINRLTSLYQ